MTPLERIIRPIVEGQIRGFLKEHPKIIEAVDWYWAKDRDPAKSFVGSLAKRIVRDLTCGSTPARLEKAILARGPGTPDKVGCGTPTAADRGDLGISSEVAP